MYFLTVLKIIGLGSENFQKTIKIFVKNLFEGKPLPILYGDGDYCVDIMALVI